MGRGEDQLKASARGFNPLYGAHPRRSRPAAPPPLPQRPAVQMGGADRGVDVRLERLESDRVIFAIKALRMATDGGLKWSKDATDLVRSGKPVQVMVHPENIKDLEEAGWVMSTPTSGGRAVIEVVLPAERIDDLREMIDELGGHVV